MVELPKGWTYNNEQKHGNRLFYILKGELTFESRNSREVVVHKQKPVDLQAILRGDKQVQKEDWQAVLAIAA